ncbi:transmembrane protein 252 [Bombina bombina]|uniref:transmembrane protein 252 n=1 Tax=Bombina bombina TaxID=8345 RepID=UPI00235AC3A4|nr:transmembrane protein 252 [Bombina bombina]
MNMRKSAYTVLRFSLLVIGFSLVCLGAFYVSSSYVCTCGNELILAYCLLPSGFILLLVGIFWSTYHEANHKSIFHNMIRRMHRQHEMHIETIDRPDFYPPSYESVIHEIQLQTQTNMTEESPNIPPPLYTESTLDIVDETYICEDPPPAYEASINQANVNTEPSSEEASGPDNGHDTETCD